MDNYLHRLGTLVWVRKFNESTEAYLEHIRGKEPVSITEERLVELETLHKRIGEFRDKHDGICPQASLLALFHHFPDLLTEIRRLQKQLTDAKWGNTWLKGKNAVADGTIKELRGKVEELEEAFLQADEGREYWKRQAETGKDYWEKRWKEENELCSNALGHLEKATAERDRLQKELEEAKQGSSGYMMSIVRDAHTHTLKRLWEANDKLANQQEALTELQGDYDVLKEQARELVKALEPFAELGPFYPHSLFVKAREVIANLPPSLRDTKGGE
jgi:chromosome segregation ATPase